MTGDDIIDRINEIGCRFVEFTGGEPLEQDGVKDLMAELCDIGYEVAVETGGHVDISDIDPRVIVIMDVKCPDSKMMTLNRLDNIEYVKPTDEVKFVIASRIDYEWAKDFIEEHDLTNRVAAVLMSPVFGTLDYVTLVNWILEDDLDVRFQIQMHKHVWDPATRGV